MWYDDYYDDNGDHWDDDNDEDKFFERYTVSKKRKAQSLNKGRALTHYLASIKMVGLVCS